MKNQNTTIQELLAACIKFKGASLYTGSGEYILFIDTNKQAMASLPGGYRDTCPDGVSLSEWTKEVNEFVQAFYPETQPKSAIGLAGMFCSGEVKNYSSGLKRVQ